MNVEVLRYAVRLGSLALMILLFGGTDASAQCQFCPGGPGTFNNGTCTDAGQGEGNDGCYDDWNPELNHHCAYNGDSCRNSPGGGPGGGEQQECFALPWWLRWLNPYCAWEVEASPLGQLGTGLRRADALTPSCSGQAPESPWSVLRRRAAVD